MDLMGDEEMSDASNCSSDMNDNAVCALTLAAGSNIGAQGIITDLHSTVLASPSVPSGSAPSPGFLAGLPSFQDVSSTEHPSLFLQKVSLCSVLFDFTQTSTEENEREKQIKRQTLYEIANYVCYGATAKLNTAMVDQCFEMIRVNIFRIVPTVHRHKARYHGSGDSRVLIDAEQEGPFREPAWPHLQIIYELLMYCVGSPETDPIMAQRYVSHLLVLLLLDLFDSEDEGEREWLRVILLQIYRKFTMHRPFIRKSINGILYRFILETEMHNGIAELLKVWWGILSGFVLPLKEENKRFFVQVLIPLHKPKCLGMYYQQLTYCITQFVEKDFTLAEMVIRGLLKYWPVISSQKELLFLDELAEVLELTQPTEFHECMIPLFKRLSRCMNSTHARVATRALTLWGHNYNCFKLVMDNRKVIFPLIFPALEENISHHWSLAVKTASSNAKTMLQTVDHDFFEECQEKYQGGVMRVEQRIEVEEE